MSTISSPGIGSGLDVNSIVGAIVDVQIFPREAMLDREQEQNDLDISAFGQLQSDLLTFRDSLKDLQRLRDFNEPIVSSSDTSIATATGDKDAGIGSYSLKVNQLAQAQSIATTNTNFTDVTSIVGGGTITIETGQFNSGKTAFESSPTPTSVDISIGTDATLAEVRNAINVANVGVTASIIKDDSTAYLIITGDETGDDNAFRITVTDDDGNNTNNEGLSSLVYDPFNTISNVTESTEAQNNDVEINGLSLSTSSNTLTDVVDGLTIELESADNSTTIQLEVENDVEGTKTAIADFVDSMSTLLEALADLTKYGVENGEVVVGDLFGDSTTRAIQTEIRNIINSPVQYLNGSITSLVDLGISFERGGSVALDEDQLDDVLENNYSEVANLMALATSASDSLIDPQSVSVTNTPGSYDLVIDDIQSIASSDSAGFTSASSTLSGGTITIAVGSYGTGKTSFTPTTTHSGIVISDGSTLTDVMDAINASAAAADVTASIITEDNEARLVITGNNSGTSNAFQVTVTGDTDGSDTDTNGLSSIAYDPTTGGTANAEIQTDVFKLGTSLTATLDGIAMTSADGFLLEGTGDFRGLSASVLGGSAGSRGTLSVSKGGAVRLDDLLDSYVDTIDGVITQKLETLNETAADLLRQREDLDDYRDSLEERYYKQFAALDVLIAESQSINNYLTQQFSNSSDE